MYNCCEHCEDGNCLLPDDQKNTHLDPCEYDCNGKVCSTGLHLIDECEDDEEFV
jgi:hypothetical protein